MKDKFLPQVRVEDWSLQVFEWQGAKSYCLWAEEACELEMVMLTGQEACKNKSNCNKWNQI